MCTSSCNIGITTCQVFAHFGSWRLYIYLPWDSGISKQVIREGILSELVAVTLVDTVRPRILCRNADLCLLYEDTLIQITACEALSWEYAMCGQHCSASLWVNYQYHLGKHQGVQPQYIAYFFNARIANYHFWFGHEKNGSILQKVSCWVLNTQALANHLNELHRVWQITIPKFLVGQSMRFPTWAIAWMLLLLCQNRLPGWSAVCSAWFELTITWGLNVLQHMIRQARMFHWRSITAAEVGTPVLQAVSSCW
jgi:hypothetical protein